MTARRGGYSFRPMRTSSTYFPSSRNSPGAPLDDEPLRLVEPPGGGVVPENAQGEAAGALPPGLLRRGPQQRPADTGPARLLRDDEPEDLPHMRVGGERGREADAEVADYVSVHASVRVFAGLGHEVVPGPEPLGVERLVRRLRPGLDGVQRGPGGAVEPPERVLVGGGGPAYARRRVRN